MTYNANNQQLLTVVTGSTQTGVYAADGSWNIVLNDGSQQTGLYHSCGAYNAVVVGDTSSPYIYKNGSMAVLQNSDATYSPVVPAGSTPWSPYIPPGGYTPTYYFLGF